MLNRLGDMRNTSALYSTVNLRLFAPIELFFLDAFEYVIPLAWFQLFCVREVLNELLAGSPGF